jgi:hypothetical protein
LGTTQARLLGLHVHGVDAVGRGVDHGFVVGGVAIHVEIKTTRVGLIGEAPDTVAGVLVDPGLRRGGLCSLGGDDRGWCEGKAGNGREKAAQHCEGLLEEGMALRAAAFWMSFSPWPGAPEIYTP